jgi:hypothetical protein
MIVMTASAIQRPWSLLALASMFGKKQNDAQENNDHSKAKR